MKDAFGILEGGLQERQVCDASAKDLGIDACKVIELAGGEVVDYYYLVLLG